jgi:hypothetical protein
MSSRPFHLGFASVTRCFEENNPLFRVQRNFCPLAVRLVRCAGSELIVLVFKQYVGCGERSVAARDILLQAFARFFGTG